MDSTAFALARGGYRRSSSTWIAEPGSIGAIPQAVPAITARSLLADAQSRIEPHRRLTAAGSLQGGESGGVLNAGFDINELKRRMQGATQSLKHELGGLRTGRVAASMLEPVQVEAYGPAHAAQSARHHQRGPNRGCFPCRFGTSRWSRPWRRRSSIPIWAFSPATEGQVLRLRISELNEERRKELVKVAHKYMPKRPRSRSGMFAATWTGYGSRSSEKNSTTSILEDDQERLKPVTCRKPPTG